MLESRPPSQKLRRQGRPEDLINFTEFTDFLVMNHPVPGIVFSIIYKMLSGPPRLRKAGKVEDLQTL